MDAGSPLRAKKPHKMGHKCPIFEINLGASLYCLIFQCYGYTINGTEIAYIIDMEKITRSKLLKNTKEELIALGKSLKNLRLKLSQSKDDMIGMILDAIEEDEFPSKKAPAAKTGKPAAKEALEKPAKVKTVKPAAKKEAVKAGPKTEPKATPAATPAPRAAFSPKAQKATFKEGVKIPSAPRTGSDEEAVEESKYHVANGQGYLESAELPDSYRDNRIVLLARDPYWAHSFWDLAPWKPEDTARNHKLDLAQFNIALRIYDVTDVEFNGVNAHKWFDLDVNTIKASWYVNVPEDNRCYLAEIGLKNRRGDFYMMARSNVIRVPRASVSNRVDEEWMVADEEFWKMYALSGGFKTRSGASAELVQEMQQRLSGETSSGAISSFGGSIRPRRAAEERFRFVLDCELIVYGATEPDAKVTLMGHHMPLRPDGTFSARFALPDGLQALEAKAVSASGTFEKTITPTVTRSTTVLQDGTLERKTEE